MSLLPRESCTGLEVLLAQPDRPASAHFCSAPLMVASLPLIAALSCAATQTPPVKAPITVTCHLPSLVPAEDTSEIQTKGGVEITVSPEPFQCVKHYKELLTEDDPTFEEIVNGAGHGPNEKFYEIKKTPFFDIEPTRTTFRVTINNHLTHMFRGEHIVLQFFVGGTAQSAPQGRFGELEQIVIPPGNQQQFELHGPPIVGVMAVDKIGVMLHEVPTKVDPAGAVVETQSFEWHFNPVTQDHSEEDVETTKRRFR